MRLKYKINYLFIAVFSMQFLSGCYTVGTIEIEVMRPAQITVPGNINRLLVVNNGIIEHNDAFSHDIQRALFTLDTTTTQILTRQVTDILNESPRFTKNSLVPEIIFRPTNTINQPINWEQVNSLCSTYETDAIVALETFGIIDTVVQFSYYDGYGYYSTYKSIALFVNTKWRVYDNINKTLLQPRIIRDTIYFEKIGSKRKYFDLILDNQGFQDMAQAIATELSIKVSDILAPYWEPVIREFINYPSEEMKLAASYAYADKWDAAAKVWSPLTENKNKNLAAAACHNMALVCEVQGKLDLALIWINKALELNNSAISQQYLLNIRYRINETLQLNKQFGIED